MDDQVPVRVVVTGVSRGIGRAIALEFAKAGASVAGLHRSNDPAVTRELTDAITGAGGRALIRVGSTASTTDVDALADAAADAWGGIDVWVNNAAQLMVKPFLETTDEDWARLLDSNLFGFIRGSRAAARHMVPAGSGRIINIGSAVETFPPTEMTAYVTAKGGITGLTRALAVELGSTGVTANTLAPGATETPLNDESWTDEVRATYRTRIPLGRIADAEDIAAAVRIFASDGARYITGQIVNVDGGLTLNGSVGHKHKDQE